MPPVCICDQGGGGSADNGWVGDFDVASRRNLKPFISIIAPIIPPLAPSQQSLRRVFFAQQIDEKGATFIFK